MEFVVYSPQLTTSLHLMFDIQFNSTELNKQIQIQLNALSVSLTEKLSRVPLIRIKQKLQLTNHLLFDTLDL